MDICRDIALGYVKCDICGDGYNVIAVCNCGDHNLFRYSRTSLCYGSLVEESVDAKRVLELLEADRFMVATRGAHTEYLSLVRALGLIARPPKATKTPKVTASSTRTIQANIIRNSFFVDWAQAMGVPLSDAQASMIQFNRAVQVVQYRPDDWLETA